MRNQLEVAVVLGKMYFSELLGFWTLSIVRYSKNTRGHNVSETGSFSFLR
jgi:hypothetical protein